MSIQRLVLLLIIVGALAVFAVENWSPMVSLVILGSQTQALPLGIWLIGAIAAGIITTLIVAGLAQISSGSSYSRQPHSSRPPRTYQSSYRSTSSRSQPKRDRPSDKQSDYSSTQTTANAAPSTSAEKAKRRSGDDWETVGQPLQDWGGWGGDPQTSSGSYTQQTVHQADENPSGSDWNGYEVVDAEPIDVEPIDVDPVDVEPVDRYAETDSDTEVRDRNRSIWSNWRGYEASDGESEEDDSQSYAEENEYSYYYDSSNLDEEEDEEEDYDTRDYDDREYDDQNYDTRDYDDDLDDLVDDWEDEHDEVDDRDDDADLRDRQITEVTREPTVRSQSGTIYSYSYRRSQDTGAGKPENIYQSEESEESDDEESELPRVIIPPHHPSSEGSGSAGREGITDPSEDSNQSDDETDDPQENP